jgi:FkbM family methyltransferase
MIDTIRIKDYLVAYRRDTDDALELHQLESSALMILPIRSGGTVIDIGAHIGTFTLQAARAVGDTGKVYAYEPHPQSYRLLLTNITINNLENVYAEQVAIDGSALNMRSLYLSSITRGHSLTHRYNEGEQIFVPSQKLFIPLGCDLLKMNCEGSEFEIIDNADLRRTRQALILYHEDLVDRHHAEIVNRFEESGFDVEIRNQTEKRGWIIAKRKD